MWRRGFARGAASSDISPPAPQEKPNVVSGGTDLEEQDQRLTGGSGDRRAGEGKDLQISWLA